MSPGITGTYAQLAAYTRRTLTRRLRTITARTLRSLAAAACPCGTCSS